MRLNERERVEVYATVRAYQYFCVGLLSVNSIVVFWHRKLDSGGILASLVF